MTKNKSKRKKYFAQNSLLGDGHRAKHFHTPEEAFSWLRENGGGTVKRRSTKKFPDGTTMRNFWVEVDEA